MGNAAVGSTRALACFDRRLAGRNCRVGSFPDAVCSSAGKWLARAPVYVFSVRAFDVAQSCTLPYRRFAIGSAATNSGTPDWMTVAVEARSFAKRKFFRLPSGKPHDLKLTEGATVSGRVLRDGKPLKNLEMVLEPGKFTPPDFRKPGGLGPDMQPKDKPLRGAESPSF